MNLKKPFIIIQAIVLFLMVSDVHATTSVVDACKNLNSLLPLHEILVKDPTAKLIQKVLGEFNLQSSEVQSWDSKTAKKKKTEWAGKITQYIASMQGSVAEKCAVYETLGEELSRRVNLLRTLPDIFVPEWQMAKHSLKGGTALYIGPSGFLLEIHPNGDTFHRKITLDRLRNIEDLSLGNWEPPYHVDANGQDVLNESVKQELSYKVDPNYIRP